MRINMNFTKLSNKLVVPPYTHPRRPGIIFSNEEKIFIPAGQVKYIYTGYMWEPDLTEELLEEIKDSFRIALRFESLYKNDKFIVVPFTTINFTEQIIIPVLNPGRHGAIVIEQNDPIAIGIIDYLPLIDITVE